MREERLPKVKCSFNWTFMFASHFFFIALSIKIYLLNLYYVAGVEDRKMKDSFKELSILVGKVRFLNNYAKLL